mmetsp:Transcript_112227/g.198826  ORF Transcript_112227/g.198826 Transcript_112227/m.198826 type:complete len:650 (+) Transcript_112227:82-2031(+)
MHTGCEGTGMVERGSSDGSRWRPRADWRLLAEGAAAEVLKKRKAAGPSQTGMMEAPAPAPCWEASRRTARDAPAGPSTRPVERPAALSGVATPFSGVSSCGAPSDRGPARVAAARAADMQARSAAEHSRVAALIAAVSGQDELHGDRGNLLRALMELRQVLSTATRPPIQSVIDLGGLVPLVQLLADSSSAVQLEAAWALTNMASGSSTQTSTLVEAGVVQALFKALLSPTIAQRGDFCNQVLWALGNIAGDGDVGLRDHLLAAGVVEVLGQLFQQVPGFAWNMHERTEVLQTFTWLMSCLCAGRPAPPLEEVDCAFDFFSQVLTGTQDLRMLSEALWGLCYLLEGADEVQRLGDSRASRGARLLAAGFGDGEEPPRPPAVHPVVAQVVRSLGSPACRSPATAPALRLIGGFVSSSNPDFADVVIAAGALKALHNLIVETKLPVQMRRDATWVLSNIAAGTRMQAQALLNEAGVWDALCRSLEQGSSQEVRHESAWAIANLAKQGAALLSRVDSHEVLRLAVLALRADPDPALQRAVLDAAEAAILYTAERTGSIGCLLATAERSGFVDELEDLQQSECESVYLKAVRVLDTWFEAVGHGKLSKENLPAKAPSVDVASPSKIKMQVKPATPTSSICQGSPQRPGYKFGA